MLTCYQLKLTVERHDDLQAKHRIIYNEEISITIFISLRNY